MCRAPWPRSGNGGRATAADKPYGQRELLVLAPDGNLIAFGQAIRPAA